MEFDLVIDSIRNNLRQKQDNGEVDWHAERIRKPLSFYLIMDRRFNPQFRAQQTLLERGRVVWRAIIQANQMLFEPDGPHASLPAAIIYCEEEDYDADPLSLVQVAHNMFDLKGKRSTRAMQQFGDKLANEIVADTKLAIPTGFADGIQCYYATVLIARKHLPEGHLADGFFPVLIAPDETDAVMILPKRFWPKKFSRVWAS